MACRWRILAAFASLTLISAGPADDGRWYAGAYSFSDELGGFRIIGIKGAGTRDDPIEIDQELYSVAPVTLVIRATGSLANMAAFHLRVVTVNRSGLGWIGFDFDLQESLGKPSDFFDGLSFDQIAPDPTVVSSDRFDHFTSQFESFDRLSFDQGHVDPADRATFGFFVTDVTPVPEFYLVEDPRVPSS